MKQAMAILAVLCLFGCDNMKDRMRGPQGEQGIQGETGPTGQTGPQGERGETGPQGKIGAMGPQGIQGIQGETGATGPQGAMGVQGKQGPIGPQGAQGPAGENGEMRSFEDDADGDGAPDWIELLAGTNPEDTEDAPIDENLDGIYDIFVGPQGPPGTNGADGANGLDGLDGEPGPMGPAGLNGLDGLPGPIGPQGPQGIQGETGATGPQGPTGETGPMGARGETGPAGPQGAIGPTGPQGEQGIQGESGPIGPPGTNGADGPTGPRGPEGPPGADGLDGENCDCAPQCPEGTSEVWNENGELVYCYLDISAVSPDVLEGRLSANQCLDYCISRGLQIIDFNGLARICQDDPSILETGDIRWIYWLASSNGVDCGYDNSGHPVPVYAFRMYGLEWRYEDCLQIRHANLCTELLEGTCSPSPNGYFISTLNDRQLHVVCRDNDYRVTYRTHCFCGGRPR